MKITKYQISDMKHAIGYKEYSVNDSVYRYGRNFFGVTGGSKSWDELVEVGYASKRISELMGGETIYTVTAEGINYLEGELNITITKSED